MRAPISATRGRPPRLTRLRTPLAGALVALCTAFTGPPARDGTPNRDTRPRPISYYHLQVSVSLDDSSVSGAVTVVARTGALGSDGVVLDAASELIIDSAQVAGAAARFAREAQRVRIEPAEIRRTAATLQVTVYYHGRPSKGLVFRTVDGAGVAASYGLPYSARHWWPCVDSPGGKADSADVDVTVPDSLTAISNGLPRGSELITAGRRTYRWSVRYPIYPDVVSIAVGRYTAFSLRADSTAPDSMTFYVYPRDLAKARSDFAVLPGILAAYERLFGPYPYPREGYGVTEFPIASFREHQTRPSYGATLITGDHRNDWILAHELAHQWFGNSLTVASWSDAWLNEGFATYASALWREATGGRVAYQSAMATFREGDLQPALFVPDSTDVHDMFTDVTFQKGAWVLHMLRHVVGDSVFFPALRRYIADHAYGTVRTADFEAEVERALGRRLDWFFREWVYGAGLPRYTITWNQATGTDVRVTITQLQPGATFRMPLDLLVRWRAGDTVVTVDDRQRRQLVLVAHVPAVTEVRLDPGAWVLSPD